MSRMKKLNLNDLNVKSFETTKTDVKGGFFTNIPAWCNAEFNSVNKCTNIYVNCI